MKISVTVYETQTIEMYANDPELDGLITYIPRKEDLCVSRTLDATLSADDCFTDQLC